MQEIYQIRFLPPGPGREAPPDMLGGRKGLAPLLPSSSHSWRYLVCPSVPARLVACHGWLEVKLIGQNPIGRNRYFCCRRTEPGWDFFFESWYS